MNTSRYRTPGQYILQSEGTTSGDIVYKIRKDTHLLRVADIDLARLKSLRRVRQIADGRQREQRCPRHDQMRKCVVLDLLHVDRPVVLQCQ